MEEGGKGRHNLALLMRAYNGSLWLVLTPIVLEDYSCGMGELWISTKSAASSGFKKITILTKLSLQRKLVLNEIQKLPLMTYFFKCNSPGCFSDFFAVVNPKEMQDFCSYSGLHYPVLLLAEYSFQH